MKTVLIAGGQIYKRESELDKKKKNNLCLELDIFSSLESPKAAKTQFQLTLPYSYQLFLSSPCYKCSR